MRITSSARRHGITDDRIRAALAVRMRMVDLGEGMTLVIGADQAAQLLEIVIADYDTPAQRVIHAMPLRQKFFEYL